MPGKQNCSDQQASSAINYYAQKVRGMIIKPECTPKVYQKKKFGSLNSKSPKEYKIRNNKSNPKNNPKNSLKNNLKNNLKEKKRRHETFQAKLQLNPDLLRSPLLTSEKVVELVDG